MKNILVFAAIVMAVFAGLKAFTDPEFAAKLGERASGLTSQVGRDEPSKKAKKPKGPAGLILRHDGSTLVVLPWEAGGETTVKATTKQLDACEPGSRYPDCLQ